MVYSVSQFKTAFTNWKMNQSPLVIFFFLPNKGILTLCQQEKCKILDLQSTPVRNATGISWKALKNRNKSDIS